MQALYFAYGSNLSSARMRRRAPSSALVGRARLSGWRLAMDKLGRDGSGKANLHADPASHVWGVVYSLAETDWPGLDASEGGYARVAVEVALEASGPVAAQTYVSQRLASDPAPNADYRRIVLAGAREQGLPAEWLAFLEGFRARNLPEQVS
jgi:gamma-glutamylcyclotransferase (GGCT)/AIG2-like uncharacterized protein YtfP